MSETPTDSVIPADHPAIKYLIKLPSYLVGRSVIDDGPVATWEFAMGKVAQSELWDFFWETIPHIVQYMPDLGDAKAESGDCPGADPYLFVPLGNADDQYICAYVSENPLAFGDSFDLILFDQQGNPIGDPVTVQTSDNKVIADLVVSMILRNRHAHLIVGWE